MRVHKLIHLDITYLRCTSCPLVFGSPSSLTRHSFLSHGLVLQPSELQPDMVLGMRERVSLTSRVEEAVAASTPDKVGLVENFLSATLEARLVLQEARLQEEVEALPPPVLRSLLTRYL